MISAIIAVGIAVTGLWPGWLFAVAPIAVLGLRRIGPEHWSTWTYVAAFFASWMMLGVIEAVVRSALG